MKSRILSILLAVAISATACGQAPGQPPGGGPTGTPAPQAVAVVVAPATRTTITQTISGVGNVVADYQVNVVPKQSGRIESLNVDVGSKVTAGEVIAQLDHTTQDLSLESARAQLESAQANLAKITSGPRPENVAVAELAVESARSKLQALLNGARPASVSSAQTAVDAAQQKLNTMLAGPQPASVTQAQASLDAAKQKLALAQAQGQPNAVKQAQANLTAAQAKLQGLVNGPRPVDIAPLEVSVSQAKDSLYSQQITRDGQCNPVNPQYICKSANAAVNAAWNGVNQASATLRAKVAPPSKTDLQQAQAAVSQAQAAYDAAKTPYTPQDIKQAQDAVIQAQANLELTAQPYTPEDIQQARDAVTQAEASLQLTAEPNTPQDIQQAQIAVKNAQQQLALAKQPYTAQDLQAAQASVDQAQAGVDQALQTVKDTTVTAPISGVVSAKNLNPGDIASTTTSIVTISSSTVKVQVSVPQTQVTDLKPGDLASISGAVLGNQTLAGKVTNVAPSGNTQNRSFTVDVTPNQQGVLLPGMFVQVAIAVRVDQNVIAVPGSAVVQKESGAYVFVVQQGVAHQVPVQLGLANANQTEITSGIQPGQLVVVEGNQDLADGQRVAISTATPVATPTP